MMSESSQTQLALIREVHQLLRDAGIPHWLFGGWSVDFHAGAITREHGDIEFFIWESDAARSERILSGAGFQLVTHPHPEEALVWRKDEQVVELYFNTVSESGEIVGRGRWADWAVPDNALGDEIRELEGVRCPIVSIECIQHVKSVYEQRTGTPPRDRDIADMAVLSRMDRN